MNKIILDNFYNELILAEECARGIVEFDDLTLMLEANSEVVKNQLVSNNDLATGAMTHLKNAANDLVKMISSLIESIASRIKQLLMSKKDKVDFNKFKEACKKDPSLAKKKITVFDYQKAKSELEKLNKQALAYDNSVENGTAHPEDADAILKNIENYVSNIGHGFSTSIEAEMLERYASSSIEAAKDIEFKLKNDLKFVEKLQKGMGEKETKKFAKKIHSYTKQYSIKRKLAEANGKTATSIGEGINNVFNDIESLVKSGVNLSQQEGPYIDDRMTPAMKALQTAKYASKNKEQIKDVAGNVLKNKSLLQKLNGNESIHDTIKSGSKMMKDVKKERKKEIKSQDSARHYAKYIGNKYYNQSASQSIGKTGTDLKNAGSGIVDHLKKAAQDNINKEASKARSKANKAKAKREI